MPPVRQNSLPGRILRKHDPTRVQVVKRTQSMRFIPQVEYDDTGEHTMSMAQSPWQNDDKSTRRDAQHAMPFDGIAHKSSLEPDTGWDPSSSTVRLMQAFESVALRDLLTLMIDECGNMSVDGKIRDLLQTAFIQLVAERKHGLRGVLVMARLYEVLSSIINEKRREGDESRWDDLVEDVAEHVMWLLGQDTEELLRLAYCSDLSKNHFLLERLVSSSIFRAMVQAKYGQGTLYIFHLELVLWIILGIGYACLDLSKRNFRILGTKRASNVFTLVVGILMHPCLYYFSVRVDVQMRYLSQFETSAHRRRAREATRRKFLRASKSSSLQRSSSQHEENSQYSTRSSSSSAAVEADSLRSMPPRPARRVLHCLGAILFAVKNAWILITWFTHRVVALLSALTYSLPLLFVLLASHRFLSREGHDRSFLSEYVARIRGWFAKPPDLLTWSHYLQVHEPNQYIDFMTFIGFPRAWRIDPMNWIELVFLILSWCAFILGRGRLISERFHKTGAYGNLMSFGCLLMWVRLAAFLKGYRHSAPFVILLTNLLYKEMRAFLLVLFCMFSGFVHAIFVNSALRKRNGEEFLRDGKDAAFKDVLNPIFITALTGEPVLEDYTPRGIDKFYQDLLIFAMVVVMLTVSRRINRMVVTREQVLIAIVAEAYDNAMSRAEELFWRSRFEIVATTEAVWGDLSRLRKAPSKSAIKAIIEDELEASLDPDELGGGVETSRRGQVAKILDELRVIRHERATRVEPSLHLHAQQMANLQRHLRRIEETVDGARGKSPPQADDPTREQPGTTGAHVPSRVSWTAVRDSSQPSSFSSSSACLGEVNHASKK